MEWNPFHVNLHHLYRNVLSFLYNHFAIIIPYIQWTRLILCWISKSNFYEFDFTSFFHGLNIASPFPKDCQIMWFNIYRGMAVLFRCHVSMSVYSTEFLSGQGELINVKAGCLTHSHLFYSHSKSALKIHFKWPYHKSWNDWARISNFCLFHCIRA